MTTSVTLPDTIGVQPWMTLPATRAVIQALEARGFAGCARFVGGCVRNTLLKQPIDDVDIATTLTPDQVTEALEAAGIKAVPTGVDHGTVTAVSGGRTYEVTTLRKPVHHLGALGQHFGSPGTLCTH
jgi:poly(A) polymerase